MDIVVIALSAVLALGFLSLGGAKIRGVPQMADNAAHLGYQLGTFRAIGVLEAAGAAGLVIGIFWPLLGIAAAAGLVALLVGAAVAHLRAKDELRSVVPAALFGVLLLVLLVLQILPRG